MKAVEITQGNQQMLMGRYVFPTYDVDAFPIGYVLLTHFGDNGEYRYDGVITKEKFDAEYQVLGELQNGFLDVIKVNPYVHSPGL